MYLQNMIRRAEAAEHDDAQQPINRGPVDIETSEKRVVVR
jgi:hypothetical protein